MNHKEHAARILACSGRGVSNEDALEAMTKFVQGHSFEIAPRAAEQIEKLIASSSVQHSDGTADVWRAVLKAGKKVTS